MGSYMTKQVLDSQVLLERNNSNDEDEFERNMQEVEMAI
jgi:hypothetical protein